MSWAITSSETRYSDGTTPVVYTATIAETAVAERFFWAYNGVVKPVGIDLCIRLEVFEVEFSGNVKDLVPECPPCNGLVHPDDYKCCQDIGELAHKTPDLDALLVRSARKIDGINVPIFRGTNVGRVTQIEGVTVFVSDTSTEAHLAGTKFDPSDVDVYASL